MDSPQAQPSTTSAAEKPQNPLVDEVLRKVGRNLVIYQQVERQLKALAFPGRLSGTNEDIAQQIEARKKQLSTQTLGTVATAALQALFVDFLEPGPAHPEPLVEPWFSISFGIEHNSGLAQSLEAELGALRVQRNRLVHHLLEHWTIQSDDSCKAVSLELDAQRVWALGVHAKLQGMLEHRAESIAVHAAALEPGGPLDQLMQLHATELKALQDSPLVRLLAEVQAKSARADGWTNLAAAGSYLWKQVPDELRELKKTWGFSSLRELVEGCQLFEVLTEPTAAGSRVLYRQAQVS